MDNKVIFEKLYDGAKQTSTFNLNFGSKSHAHHRILFYKVKANGESDVYIISKLVNTGENSDPYTQFNFASGTTTRYLCSIKLWEGTADTIGLNVFDYTTSNWLIGVIRVYGLGFR